jgi:hypothetical protein
LHKRRSIESPAFACDDIRFDANNTDSAITAPTHRFTWFDSSVRSQRAARQQRRRRNSDVVEQSGMNVQQRDALERPARPRRRRSSTSYRDDEHERCHIIFLSTVRIPTHVIANNSHNKRIVLANASFSYLRQDSTIVDLPPNVFPVLPMR